MPVVLESRPLSTLRRCAPESKPSWNRLTSLLRITAQDFPTQLTGVDGLGAALQEIRRAFRPAIVCTTLGEAGSLTLTAEGEIRTPGFLVDTVDTTGAGDVFRGGFIAGWLLGGAEAQVADVLRYANATAALKCRALGGRSGIPTREEVAALMM